MKNSGIDIKGNEYCSQRAFQHRVKAYEHFPPKFTRFNQNAELNIRAIRSLCCVTRSIQVSMIFKGTM